MMALLSKFLGAIVAPIRNLFYWIGRLIPGLKRAPKISVPMRYALLLFFATLTVVIILLIRVGLDPSRYLGHPWWFWLILAGLLIGVPVATYYAIKLILQGDISRFPDIDSDWKQGMAALQQHGIPFGDTPLFVVLGGADHDVADRMMGASKISMNVTQTPNGPASLHWYANQEAIFLYLTGTSCTSALAELWGKPERRTASNVAANNPAAPSAAAARGTIVAGSTDQGGGFNPDQTERVDNPGSPPPPPPSSAVMQTMQVDPTKSISGSVANEPVTAHQEVRVELPPHVANEQEARLEFVCDMIRKHRYPVCPVNGVLSLIPFGVVDSSPDQVQIAVQRDIHAVRDRLKLRCPVAVLVNDMESEPGFRELVRRVGAERAQVQRFGKGSHVWNPPTKERLDAVARQACGAFEDWTYMLFREHDGLRKPGNTKLFSLLCKIRGGFTDALAAILENGFGFDPQQERYESESQLLFSGCYFAASGATDDRQAFVHGVYQKMIDQQGELSWTPDALHENESQKMVANVLALLAILSIAALLYMIAINQGWLDAPAFLEEDSASGENPVSLAENPLESDESERLTSG